MYAQQLVLHTVCRCMSMPTYLQLVWCFVLLFLQEDVEKQNAVKLRDRLLCRSRSGMSLLWKQVLYSCQQFVLCCPWMPLWRHWFQVRQSQICSDCLTKPPWTGNHEVFLQLSLQGTWGRAMPLSILQQLWNGACRLDRLCKVITSAFIALGDKVPLSKGKEGEQDWCPSPRECGAHVQKWGCCTESPFPLLPIPASVLKG